MPNLHMQRLPSMLEMGVDQSLPGSLALSFASRDLAVCRSYTPCSVVSLSFGAVGGGVCRLRPGVLEFADLPSQASEFS